MNEKKFIDIQQLIQNIENDINFLKTHHNIFLIQNKLTDLINILQKTCDYFKNNNTENKLK